MHLVDIGERAELFGEIADGRDRRHVAVHRIDRFEDDELWPLAIERREQFAQMADVVVAEDLLLHARLAHALDHRGVVELIGEDHAVGEEARDGRDRSFVGDEAGGEDQRRFLAVQIGERALELDQRAIGTRDVARAAGADAEPASRLLHGRDYLVVLSHAQVIVGAPDGDLPGIVGLIAKQGAREASRDPFDVGENAVALFLPERVNGVFEYSAIIHLPCLCLSVGPAWHRVTIEK